MDSRPPQKAGEVFWDVFPVCLASSALSHENSRALLPVAAKKGGFEPPYDIQKLQKAAIGVWRAILCQRILPVPL